jgi:hypothetical protein
LYDWEGSRVGRDGGGLRGAVRRGSTFGGGIGALGLGLEFGLTAIVLYPEYPEEEFRRGTALPAMGSLPREF